jgi:hypothetical protein
MINAEIMLNPDVSMRILNYRKKELERALLQLAEARELVTCY